MACTGSPSRRVSGASYPFRHKNPGEGRQMSQISSRQIALVSTLSAMYAVTSFFPISVYIGGEGLITANVMILPVIAYLFNPVYAAAASLIGAIVMFATGTSITPVYGLLTPLVTLSGGLLGSLTKKNRFAAVPFALVGLGSYLLFSGGTPLWAIFYILPLITALMSDGSSNLRILNICIATTISELVAMDMGSIFLLDFPGFLWIIILPFAIYERAVSVIGSYALVKVFKRYVTPPQRNL